MCLESGVCASCLVGVPTILEGVPVGCGGGPLAGGGGCNLVGVLIVWRGCLWSRKCPLSGGAPKHLKELE